MVRGAVACAEVQGGAVGAGDLVRVHSEAQEELQAGQRAVAKARIVQQGEPEPVGPRFDLPGTMFLEGGLQLSLPPLVSQLVLKLDLRGVGMAGSNGGGQWPVWWVRDLAGKTSNNYWKVHFGGGKTKK